MINGNSLTVIQLNDSHAYFDLHQEMFWQGAKAVYRPAGGYARIATLVKQIRAANPERVLFCDCGDTLQGIPWEVTLNDLYNMIPMNPPISTVELTGEEIVAMLEENLERTFARDPYDQMGGYVKRSLGFNAYIKIENPPGQRVQQVFVGDEPLQPGRYYPTAFVTEQGVARKYGRNHQQHTERSIDALRAYLAGHRPLRAELRGTFIAV